MSDTTFSTHHILPLRLYIGVGAALLILTGITVWVAKYDLGSINLIVAMLVAGVKASLVVLYFMHLKYDNRIYMTVFLLALLMLATFITLTMADTMRRGEINPIEAWPIRDQAEMYESMPATGAASDTLSAVAEKRDSVGRELGTSGMVGDSIAAARSNQGMPSDTLPPRGTSNTRP